MATGAARVERSEAQSGRIQVRGASVTKPFFAGVAEKGPVGVPIECSAQEDYIAIFGGHVANGDLRQAADGFFAGATSERAPAAAYFVRVVHYSDPEDRTTKTSVKASRTLLTAALAATAALVLGTVVGPFALTPGQTVKLHVDGGGAITSTIDAASASVTAANAATYALTNGMTLTVKIDRGTVQTIPFLTAEFVAIGAATAAEVAAVIAAKITGASTSLNGGKPKITSDKKGTGSHVEVTGGTANVALGFSTVEVNGTGDCADINAVTVAELKTVIEADIAGVTVSNVGGAVQIVSNTTGGSSSLQVDATSTAASALGLDTATHTGLASGTLSTLEIRGKYDGTYAHSLSILLAVATSGVAGEFSIEVQRAGRRIERLFDNLSMDPASPRYVETIVNDADVGSTWIEVEDLAAATTPVLAAPAAGTFTLTGGNDGLAGLVDADFVGTYAGKQGMRACDAIIDAQIVALPGRATPAAHLAMLNYCEVIRGGRMFAVLDPPAHYNAAQIRTYVKSTAGIKELSEYGAMYWPRIGIKNPDTAVFGNSKTLNVAPSGDVIGIMCRNDARNANAANVNAGRYEAPAGIEWGALPRAIALEDDEDNNHDVRDEKRRGQVFDDLVNPIVGIKGRAIHIDGARTLKSTGPFPKVPQRRGAIWLENAIDDSIFTKKHRNITDTLLAECQRETTTFLTTEMFKGAFATRVPETAFKVDFSPALNPPSSRRQEQVRGRIGFNSPDIAEFFFLEYFRDDSAIEAELLAAA